MLLLLLLLPPGRTAANDALHTIDSNTCPLYPFVQEMEAQQLDEVGLDAGAVPGHKIPQAAQPALPAMPSAPTRPAPAAPAKTAEELELEALQAELA